jgi:N-acetylglucosamine-6-phosphate deacetylase
MIGMRGLDRRLPASEVPWRPGEEIVRIVAREWKRSGWVELKLQGRQIESVCERPGPAEPSPGDLWVAPAFWDLQINGRWGQSFSSPELTVDQVVEIVRAQAALGTSRLCPTLISAELEAMRHGLRTIAEACERFPEVAAMVLGIHLEGPFLSDRDGYRGAHPPAALRDPDWTLFTGLQEASGQRIILITLAPERAGAIPFIERATKSGVVVALGHTAADGPTIRRAVDAGARLSTHLGNGIAQELPRHPNPIWHQAAEDRLWASLIADGHHLDADTLRVLVRAKAPPRILLVSDASPLSGLPVGTYGPWEVDPSGKILVTGTPYLAGSNLPLGPCLGNFLEVSGEPLRVAIETVTSQPARLLGREPPELTPGAAANLILFRRPRQNHLELRQCCVDGIWHEVSTG